MVSFFGIGPRKTVVFLWVSLYINPKGNLKTQVGHFMRAPVFVLL